MIFNPVSGFTGSMSLKPKWPKRKPTRSPRTPDIKWHAKVWPGKRCRQFGKASHDRKTGTCKDIVYNIPMRAATSSEMNPNRMFKIHISSIVQLSIEIILYALHIFIILVYSPFSLPSLSKTSVTSVQSSCRDQHCVVSQASSIGTITIIPSVKCNLSLFQSKLVIDARFELWSTVCSPCFLCGEA